MTDKIQALYYIKDLRDDNIIYVGKTRDFERRKNQHFGNKKKQPIDLYMFEQGRYNFEMLPFTDDDYSIKTDEELVKAEDKKILELQPLMNIRRSGLIVNKDPKKYHREYSNQYYKNSEERKKYFNEYHKSEKYKEYRREYRKQRKAKLIENI